MNTPSLRSAALVAAFPALAAAGAVAQSMTADAARPDLVIHAPVPADNVDADNAARAAEAGELSAQAGRVPTF